MYRFHRWRVEIESAADERAVARTIQDYLRTLSPAMIDSLPTGCREALLSANVQSAALVLLKSEADYRGALTTASLLHEIAYTFAAASARVAALRMHARP